MNKVTKYISILMLTMSLVFIIPQDVESRRGCTGSKNCTACKSCNGCKHCAKQGGTCGVCYTPPKKEVLKSDSTKTKVDSTQKK